MTANEELCEILIKYFFFIIIICIIWDWLTSDK